MGCACMQGVGITCDAIVAKSAKLDALARSRPSGNVPRGYSDGEAEAKLGAQSHSERGSQLKWSSQA